jgi:hypothetical protein
MRGRKMNAPPRLATMRPLLRVGGAVLLAVAIACSETPLVPASGPAVMAKAGNGGGGGGTSGDVVVSSAVPDTGVQGTTLDVTISGSGFTSDMEVTWELDGVADPSQVRTNKTTYVSSKKLVANITIAGGATTDQWDIRVMSRGGKGGIGIELFKVVLDQTSDWLLPLADADLDFRSDRRNATDGYSVYADGDCGVTSHIFLGGSGDATANSGSSKKCPRTFSARYPDGLVETFTSFANVRKLAAPSIPLGHTQKRTFAINPGTHRNNPNRCGRLLFGVGDQGNGVGSDSVLVTRLDARTWEIRTQDPPDNKALCESNGEIYPMRVHFKVRTRIPFP